MSERRSEEKIVLWYGYIGTAYKGNTQDTAGDGRVVEAQLWRAVDAARGVASGLRGHNAIHCSYQDRSHIDGFSRSSRTDAGVHAVSNLVCLNTEVLASGDSPTAFVGRLNSALPSDVRVFARVSVPTDFHARRFCDQRTYRYVLPASLLRLTGTVDSDLRECMNLFVGKHSWHNFTQNGAKPDAKFEAAVDSITCELRTAASGVAASGEDPPMAVISICGNHFIYHQIRRIVGMVLALRAGISKDYVARAFDVNVHDLPVPLAPGFGLYLQQCRYTGYARRHGLNKRLQKQKDTELAIAESAWEKQIFEHCASSDKWSEWAQELHEVWIPRMSKSITVSEGDPELSAARLTQVCVQGSLEHRKESDQGHRFLQQYAGKQAGRDKRLMARLARAAEPGAAAVDRAAVLSDRLWVELVAPATMGQTGAAAQPTGQEKKALREFYNHAVKEYVSKDHVTNEAARAFTLDKWVARCDKQCQSLLSLAETGCWPGTEASDTLRVASIGGGPANDACGAFVFAALLGRWRRVDATVFDFSVAWRPFCEAIAEPDLLKSCAQLLSEGRAHCEFSLGFHEADLREPVSAGVNERLLAAAPDVDLFLFSFVVRESEACKHELLPALLRSSQKGAVFVFMDMHVTDLVPVKELVERLQQEDSECPSDGKCTACSFESVSVGGSEQYAFFGIAFVKVS